jgi:hypothetical protein
MPYIKLKKNESFTDTRKNWAIGYAGSEGNFWFTTKLKFLYYECPFEFKSEIEAIHWFENSLENVAINQEALLLFDGQGMPYKMDNIWLTTSNEEIVFKKDINGLWKFSDKMLRKGL